MPQTTSIQLDSQRKYTELKQFELGVRNRFIAMQYGIRDTEKVQIKKQLGREGL